MSFLGFGKRGNSNVEERFEELCDQAELAETAEEQKAINKSILELVGDNIIKAANKKKKVDDDDFTDDDLSDDADLADIPDDEGGDDLPLDDELDDDEADAELEARIEAAKKANRKKQKIKKSIELYAPELSDYHESAVDASSILDTINDSIEISATMIRKSAARTARLESRIDELTANITPLLEFVEDARRGGVPTPLGDAGITGEVLQKGLTLPTGSQTETADYSSDTLRGLTPVQLIKGTYKFLQNNPNNDLDISVADIDEIGRVPMDELNPKLAEVAAQELGVELE